MATLTTTQTSPSLLGGVVIIGAPSLARGCSPAGGHVRGVVLLVDGGAGLYRFCMLHSGLMILEANLNYRIGSSFDTITKDLLGKAGTLLTAFLLPLCSTS